MHKLLFGVLMIVVWWMLHGVQMDEELAMGTLHEGKRAIDRAAHAAAQQVDRDKLEWGVLSISSAAARTTAMDYLQANLRLGTDLEPQPGSWLREGLEVRVFQVINEDVTFPYTYRNPEYGYEVTLDRPGVVLIAHMKYPRIFGILAPVEWDLKGTAELVYT
ncbi:hypothetical protein [Cohnella nanjingensis]|uniref:Uncharacterized protein n=1 Tax=Cohnella nanjingensis TaxID=1387779 RepID=A0A7X0RV40_9BACL|nr:hypothetical protein [Cohnella nanjingensis]MBB6672649.1 hypothetical protein [Cohnella nanjingensis]